MTTFCTNDGPYLRSMSPLYLDPSYSMKDTFVIELVYKNPMLVGDKLQIAGIFLFQHQRASTFKNILNMLIEAAPDMERARIVNTDGCRVLGKQVDVHFPLAFHGVDRNHVEKNLTARIWELALTETEKQTLKLKVLTCSVSCAATDTSCRRVCMSTKHALQHGLSQLRSLSHGHPN